jgi:excisionase family DNA binding protein
LLGVHPRTLQRMVLRGEIAGVHVGKLWRFRPSAIDQWIERQLAG